VRADPNHSSAFTAYCDSKLANILFTKALTDRLELTGITAHALHPGMVRSNLWSHSSRVMQLLILLALPFARSNEQAAKGIVRLVTDGNPASGNGKYFKNGRPARTSAQAANRAEAHRLWRISADETGVGE
jgi:NAD(P)-dependent dehydrogenase (short-subunit alcohol dehydrogenase family)